jgi:UDP-N-acetylglucosamine--N-acetylmuramyl-(pentapeptide) pyrophosphoryl-undecaprenol N-acetylglucosamine transferase
VFSTGGYLTVPVCLVAWLKRIPIVIHEQTTRVGLSNKISSFFAHRILVGFHAAEKFFPKKKIKFVGNTVRDIFWDPWREEYIPCELKNDLERFKKNKEKYPVVFLSGGGQGSHLINTNISLALRNLLGNYQLIIQTGDNRVNRDYEKLTNELKKLSVEKQKRAIITKFAGAEMGAYFDLADLFVGRSGALFTYEVGATKTPAIFIPIPWVTHNEQYYNAKVLEDLGLAEILPQGVLNPEILVQKISKMVDKVRRGDLKIKNHALDKFFVKDGAKNIVNHLKRYMKL